MSSVTVKSFMTPTVWTIGQDASLSVAREMMDAHAIRHLPVLHGGELVGIVSQRDIQLLETLRDVDPREVTVEEAMSQDVLLVDPDDTLAEVARAMAAHKYGSALVSKDRHALLGIFTTHDALKALDGVLSSPVAKRAGGTRKASSQRPSLRGAPRSERSGR